MNLCPNCHFSDQSCRCSSRYSPSCKYWVSIGKHPYPPNKPYQRGINCKRTRTNNYRKNTHTRSTWPRFYSCPIPERSEEKVNPVLLVHAALKEGPDHRDYLVLLGLPVLLAPLFQVPFLHKIHYTSLFQMDKNLLILTAMD